MWSFPKLLRNVATGLVVAVLAASGASPVAAHEIPANVTVRAFVKPEGDRLRLLLRVPLESIRDINFPVRGPGYLEMDQLEGPLYAGARLWLADFVEIYENDRRVLGETIVAARVSLPSDPSFGRYEDAIRHVFAEGLPSDTELVWQQALLDVLIDYPISSAESEFSIRPELGHLGIRTSTVLHFLPSGGAERVFQFLGDPGLVRLDPRWHHAAASFVKLGFQHILGGIDHILFVLLLVIPLRRVLPLLAVVSSFTVAHSVTLVASALGLAPNALWFPPLIETLIALSIVYMALENIVSKNLTRRWQMAFGFGLIHGFGFSFLLSESLQFAGSHLLLSLFAFNVGVELGQIVVLVLSLPLLALLYRYVVAERMGVIILSALIAHTAWHWMAERYADFAQYPLEMPVLGLAFAASLMRWTMLALILALMIRLMSGAFGALGLGLERGDGTPTPSGEPAEPAEPEVGAAAIGSGPRR
jgi:hypothetical protein